jgi:hypothetical protein
VRKSEKAVFNGRQKNGEVGGFLLRTEKGRHWSIDEQNWI